METILKFILALLPILWLIVALCIIKMEGYKAAGIAFFLTILLSILYWKMPVQVTISAGAEGVLTALWPICLVIIAALFTYHLTLKTGAMEKIKQMLGTVSMDKRILALLIGWGFGNFMEGMAGFGTAVAIPVSMLVAIGLDPMGAVIGCLVVNSTPTAFGSVGVPTMTLATVTGIDSIELASSVAIIQCILTFLSPFFLVCICGRGLKALKGMMTMTLIASLSFVVPWVLVAKMLGPELPDIVGSICSMICIVIAAKLIPVKGEAEYLIEKDEQAVQVISTKEGIKAWLPFIFIFVFLMLTSTLCQPIHSKIVGITSEITVYMGENGNKLKFSWINTPGVIIFISAFLGGILQGATIKEMGQVFGETLKKYWKTVVTVCSVMAIAKIMGYSGMIDDIAHVLVITTGKFYPFIAPAIGALGAFVTGSGTSTCVLFGRLQSETALSLGFQPIWMAAANVLGAGIGKMVCPQGLAIGASAIGMLGKESKILKGVFPYFLFYVIVSGIICFILSARIGYGI